MEITATIRRVSGVTANVSRPGNISTTVTRIGGSGTSDYEELENKPSINGVELVGDKSTADLLIDVGVTSVNGNTGDVTLNIPTVPTDVSAFNNDAQYVNASQAAAAAPVQSVNGSTGAVTISPKIVYATCSTISTTAAKEATIVSGTLDTLTAGDQVIVYFTASNAAGSPTLKVGNTAAKSIMRYEAVTPGSTVSASWNAQSPVMFVYDGTYWKMLGWLNTTYSTMPESEAISGTASTDRLIAAKVLKKGVETHAPVKSVNGQTGAVTLTIPTVPTDVSSFNNDAGYLTLSTLPVYSGGVSP